MLKPLVYSLTLVILAAAFQFSPAQETREASLTIIATVPEGTGDVYLPGNLDELGPWNPGGLKMEGTGTTRKATLRVPVGTTVEFKLTQGSWAKEELNPDFTVPENYSVTVTEDMEHEVEAVLFKSLDVEMPYPDPLRYEDDIKAFEKMDRREMPAPGQLLAVGSSSIVYWHASIEEDLAPVPVVPRGFGGSTMHDLIYFTDRVVFPYEPAALLVYEGDNDIAANVPVSKVLRKYDTFIDLVETRLPRAHIFMLPAKPSPSRIEYLPRMRELNAEIRERCEANPNLTYIDTATPLLDETGSPDPKYFLDDMLHLNPEGYKVWAKVTRPIVVEWWEARK
mgnify:CR=1 FL=1